MTIPVLLVVDDDRESLGVLDRTVRRRYGQDYLIISELSAAAALGHLRELQAAGREVAVVMAASARGMTGTCFPAPSAGRDEEFHRAISELPDEWAQDTAPAAALLVVIGAVPHTDWLPPLVARDEHALIVTGSVPWLQP